MFTSRAEHRLVLRQDNADLRLSELGFRVGLLSQDKYDRFSIKQSRLNGELARLERTRVGSETLVQILRRPESRYADLPHRDESLPTDIINQIEIEVKYAGYIERQASEIERIKTLQEKRIPTDFNFESVPSLRLEARQKLAKVRPATVGQAARISGVSPADVSILVVWLKRYKTALPEGSKTSDKCACDD